MSHKLVVVGDGMVGKTALIQSFVNRRFENNYTPTVFETHAEDVHLADGRSLTLSLWDTGGQEEFDQIRQLAYPGASVLLMCYAIDSETSLRNILHTWNKEVRHFCPISPVLLVGCKSDLRSQIIDKELKLRYSSNQKSLIDPSLAVEVQRQIGATVNIECSAINRSNVMTVFHLAGAAILDSLKPERSSLVFGKQKIFLQKKKLISRKCKTSSKSSYCCVPLNR